MRMILLLQRLFCIPNSYESSVEGFIFVLRGRTSSPPFSVKPFILTNILFLTPASATVKKWRQQNLIACGHVDKKLIHFRSKSGDEFADWNQAMPFLANIKLPLETTLMLNWTVCPLCILMSYYTLTMQVGMVCLFS